MDFGLLLKFLSKVGRFKIFSTFAGHPFMHFFISEGLPLFFDFDYKAKRIHFFSKYFSKNE